MKRRDGLMACALWAVAAVAMAAEAALPPMSAEQLLEKNAAARGGAAAWRAVNAISYAGEMDAGGKKEVRLPYTLTLQRPKKSRLEIKFQDQTAVQVFDGSQGWKLRPYLNRDDVEPYSPNETRSAIGQDEIDGALIDHARKGIQVAAAGTEVLDGVPTYKLKLTGGDGVQRFVWLDGKTFLEARIEGEPRRIDGRERKVVVWMKDYRREGALVLPHELVTEVVGTKSIHKLSIKTVTVEPKIEAATFAKPQPGVSKVASR